MSKQLKRECWNCEQDKDTALQWARFGTFGVEDKEVFHFQREAEVDSRTIFATGLKGESGTSGAFTEPQKISEKNTECYIMIPALHTPDG